MPSIPKHKTGLQSKWATQPRTDVSDEIKRIEREKWEALNTYIVRHGGMVVSPPAKLLRVEVMKDSMLPSKLEELGYNVWRIGSNTRVGGEKGFTQVDVIEISVSGR